MKFHSVKRSDYGLQDPAQLKLVTMSEIVHVAGAIPAEQATRWFTELRTVLPWTEWRPYAKTLRLCAQLTHGTAHAQFPELFAMLETAVAGRAIVGVFCNYYRDGQDSAPYHKDLYGCDILSVSFGATRDFCVKDDGTRVVTKYALASGDVLFFPLAVNERTTHSVPKRVNRSGVPHERINLTCFLAPV